MMPKVRKAVIPAAGYGTRFLPITKVVPKELLPIGNKPAIQYVVEEAVAAGIEEIILICHPTKLAIVEYFHRDLGLESFLKEKGKDSYIQELRAIENLARFTVIFQQEALGLGHAVSCARGVIGHEPFCVMLPDVLVVPQDQGLPELIAQCRSQNTWGLLLEKVSDERISSYGVVVPGKDKEQHLIKGAIEKPKKEEAPSNLAILGRYFFPPEIFDFIETGKKGALGEVQLTDAIHRLAAFQSGLGVECLGRVLDVGVPEGLIEAGRVFESLGKKG